MKKWEEEQRKKAHMRRVIQAKPTLSKICISNFCRNTNPKNSSNINPRHKPRGFRGL